MGLSRFYESDGVAIQESIVYTEATNIGLFIDSAKKSGITAYDGEGTEQNLALVYNTIDPLLDENGKQLELSPSLKKAIKEQITWISKKDVDKIYKALLTIMYSHKLFVTPPDQLSKETKEKITDEIYKIFPKIRIPKQGEKRQDTDNLFNHLEVLAGLILVGTYHTGIQRIDKTIKILDPYEGLKDLNVLKHYLETLNKKYIANYLGLPEGTPLKVNGQLNPVIGLAVTAKNDRTQSTSLAISNDEILPILSEQIEARKIILTDVLKVELFQALKEGVIYPTWTKSYETKTGKQNFSWKSLESLLVEIIANGQLENFLKLLNEFDPEFSTEIDFINKAQKLFVADENTKAIELIECLKLLPNIHFSQSPSDKKNVNDSKTFIKTHIQECLTKSLETLKNHPSTKVSLLRHLQAIEPSLATFCLSESDKVVPQSLTRFLSRAKSKSTFNDEPYTRIKVQDKNGNVVQMTITAHQELIKAKFYKILDLAPTTPIMIKMPDGAICLNHVVGLKIIKKLEQQKQYENQLKTQKEKCTEAMDFKVFEDFCKEFNIQETYTLQRNYLVSFNLAARDLRPHLDSNWNVLLMNPEFFLDIEKSVNNFLQNTNLVHTVLAMCEDTTVEYNLFNTEPDELKEDLKESITKKITAMLAKFKHKDDWIGDMEGQREALQSLLEIKLFNAYLASTDILLKKIHDADSTEIIPLKHFLETAKTVYEAAGIEQSRENFMYASEKYLNPTFGAALLAKLEERKKVMGL